MKSLVPSLAFATLVLAGGSAFAASPSRLGDSVSLNPQPLPPGGIAETLSRKPPVCLSCPSPGLRLPGSDRSLNPQPLPPKWLGSLRR